MKNNNRIVKKQFAKFSFFMVLCFFIVAVLACNNNSDRDLSNKKVKKQDQPFISDSQKKEAQKFLDLGVNALNTGNTEQAISYWRQAQQVYSSVNHDLGVATCQGSISKVLLYTGQFEKAAKEAGLAIPVMEKYGFGKKMTKYLLVRAEALFRLGEIAESKKVFEVALAKAKSLGMQDREAEALLGIAVNEKRLGQFYSALSHLERALPLAQQSDWSGGVYNSYLNFAEVHRQLGNYFKSLEYTDKAAAVKDQMQSRGMAVDWEDVELVKGATLRILKTYDEAEKILDRVHLSLSKKKEKRSNRLVEVLGSLGNIKKDQYSYVEALNYYKNALEIAGKTGFKQAVDRLNGLIGDVYLAQGKYAQAERYYVLAKNDIKKCELLLKQKKYAKALSLTRSLIASEKKWGRSGILFQLYGYEAEAHENLKEYKEAFESAFNSFLEFQQLRAGLEDPMRLTFESRGQSPVNHLVKLSLALHDKNNGLSVGRELGDNYQEFAFSISEYMKGRLLLDTMAHSISGKLSSPNVSSNLLKKEEELLDMESMLNASEHDANQLQQYPQKKAAYNKKKKEFVKELYKGAPLYAMANYPKPLSYQQIIVQDDEAVLSYFYDGDKIILFLLTQNGPLRTLSIPLQEPQLSDLLNDYRRNIQIDQNALKPNFDYTIAARMYQLFIKPAEHFIKDKTVLTIIPDGPLSDIPFETFITGDGFSSHNFVIDTYQVKYFPSASIMTFLRQSEKTAHQSLGKILAIADPIFSIAKQKQNEVSPTLQQIVAGKLRRLPDDEGDVVHDNKMETTYIPRLQETTDEVKAIAEIVGNENVKILLRSSAQESMIKKLPLKDYNILHFATHGVLADEFPPIREPALVFSLIDTGEEDGFLTLSEVTRLGLDADIVVLSACNTGRGKFVMGEGVASMSWGFMCAGARSLVVSLWSVDSDAAKENMIKFYQKLYGNMTTSKALRKAKLELKQKYPHPAYWAPFILQGD